MQWIAFFGSPMGRVIDDRNAGFHDIRVATDGGSSGSGATRHLGNDRDK